MKPYTQVGGEFSPSCNTGSLLPTNCREVQDPDRGQTLPFRLRESIGGDWGGGGGGGGGDTQLPQTIIHHMLVFFPYKLASHPIVPRSATLYVTAIPIL